MNKLIKICNHLLFERIVNAINSKSNKYYCNFSKLVLVEKYLNVNCPMKFQRLVCQLDSVKVENLDYK